MGKAFQGILGDFSGRVGHVVGRIRRGEQTYSIYQHNVNQPNTEAQLLQRKKFSLLVETFNRLGSWTRLFGKPLRGMGQTAQNAMVAMAFKSAPFTGVYPATKIDPLKLEISSGALDLPYNIVANVDGYDIVASWTDNSGDGYAKAKDNCGLALYNAVKDVWTTVMPAAKREDVTATIVVPTSWSSDTIHAYLAFMSEDETMESKSVYLGSFTV